jgi:replication factor C small subunit
VDAAMRQTVEHWLAERSLPHLLFSGHSGTGKTALLNLLLELLEIPKEDLLHINASRERKIDDLQDKIINFIDAWVFGPTGIKYVFLDEADKLSHHSQSMLRAEIQTYSDSCRFVMTCNYSNKIIEPLRSRLQEVKFVSLDQTEFTLRAADVLIQEKVLVEPEVLLDYVARTYPDMRKCLNMLQQNSHDGMLSPPPNTVEGTQDYLLVAIDLFKAGRYLEGRKLIIDQADPEEYPEMFRFLYQHLDLFGGQLQQDKALVAICDCLRHHSTVADQEINFAACLAELTMIAGDTQ